MEVLSVKDDENVDAVFQTSPRTLLQLASLRLALHIWLEKFAEKYQQRTSKYMKLTQLQVEAELLREVPTAIRKTIKSWFYPIALQLSDWFEHSKDVLHYLTSHDIYTRFNLFVFGGNGTIHIKDSVANFIEDDTLFNVTRFEIACVYCVEDKIDFFWPLVRDDWQIAGTKYHHNFMMYYWICRKRGELNRIPLDTSDSIEHLMIKRCTWHPNWLAIEYFLTLLDPDDRLDQINRLFRSCGKYQYVRILPFLEASLQQHILSLEGTHILAVFVEYYKVFDYAIQSWLFIRSFITGEQFYWEVIHRFIYVKAHDCEYIERVLEEIWSYSPPHLKQFVLNFHFIDVLRTIASFRHLHLQNFSRDISFALALISDADVDLRKTFWNESWSEWIEGVSSAHLHRIMELCLMSPDAIDDFKTTIKDSDVFVKYCDTLITRGYHNELDEFLSYLCSSEEEVLDIKIQLLTTTHPWKENLYIYKPHNVEQVRECAKFVDKLLSSDGESKGVKNHFVLAEDELEIFYDKFKHTSFLDSEIMVLKVISSEKRLELKNILLTRFRNWMIKGDLQGFKESDCETFLMWYANDDQRRIRNYVKSLPIDIDSRETFWKEAWSKWNSSVSTAHLNQLVALCLVSIEAIDGFTRVLKDSELFTKYCDKMVTRRCHNELNGFLSRFCSNEQEALNTKMKLLTGYDDWKKCIYKPHNVEQIPEWAEFIDKVLLNENLAKDFKNQLILNEDNLKIFYDILDHNSFLEIESIVENFVCSGKRSELREKLLAGFRNRIMKGELHGLGESDFENFVMWCVGDDQQQSRNFMKSLPINDIFEVAFSNCLKFDPYAKYGFDRFVKKCKPKDLDKFLAWYFESTSLCENFKSVRVEYYEGMLGSEVESIFSLDKESVIEGMKEL